MSKIGVVADDSIRLLPPGTILSSSLSRTNTPTRSTRTVTTCTSLISSTKSSISSICSSWGHTNNYSTTATTARTTTASSASITSSDQNELFLPTNICSVEQLDQLPVECLSGDPIRPIQHVSEDGRTITTYALRPMQYSVLFILIVEMLERFSFYSINYTQASYLTGQYNPYWNANMDAITASSYVSVSIAVAYTAPFLGAILGDSVWGEYKTILYGAVLLYWPGLLLIALTTVPHLFHQPYFNHSMLAIGFLFLWPIGSGIVKSVVNIFGAKQFHPLLQSSLIEVYYVNFYMCINVGALVGGIAVPLIAQSNVTIAYFLPVSMLSIGICLFLLASSRYVMDEPKGTIPFFSKILSTSKSNTGVHLLHTTVSSSSSKTISTKQLFQVFLLIVPFCIAYSQMPTTFIIQGTIMTKAFGGHVDAALMYNNDTVSVLIFGYIIGSVLYPSLARHNLKIPTTYKFAIGSAFGSMAIAWALFVDYKIRTEYNTTGRTISILWQAVSYILIGIGEIFAISSAYEVAFTASPPETKVLSSALNIFCIGGIPNVICIVLYQLCRPWFTNIHGTTNLTDVSEYTSARIDKYFWVLLGISTFGVIINVLPPIRKFVESIEETSISLLKTPKTPKTPMIRRQRRREDEYDGGDYDDEEKQRQQQQALLQQNRHEFYLKYGTDRTLYHSGSMRAGPILKTCMVAPSSKQPQNQAVRSNQHQQQGTKSQQRGNYGDDTKKLKKTIISKLYRTTPGIDDSRIHDSMKMTMDANTIPSVTTSFIRPRQSSTSNFNTTSMSTDGSIRRKTEEYGRPVTEVKPANRKQENRQQQSQESS